MTFEKLQEILVAQFDVDPSAITEETSFRNDLNADSLDMVDMIMSVQEAFGIEEIDDEELAEIDTVGQVVALIESKI